MALKNIASDQAFLIGRIEAKLRPSEVVDL